MILRNFVIESPHFLEGLIMTFHEPSNVMVFSFLDFMKLVNSLQFIIFKKCLHIFVMLIINFLKVCGILLPQSLCLTIVFFLLLFLLHGVMALECHEFAVNVLCIGFIALESICMFGDLSLFCRFSVFFDRS
ncbi:hypothetical protein TRFO_06416 [Tritrichomonas foetus]|uniref:Uncharacterized protein n=1 Tax=Tritrichomonas foetus TaxID=1144522 RepID=A0A1J4JY79_9EUKA|nr:hypothetical protein TRFO_06416 [Tritrichomonas foetus]|eukprot:OHT04113.1 hypothetical protein TRFO_06416 [Tritrichomonas foetus]